MTTEGVLAASEVFAEVAVPVPLDRTFHYRIPAELAGTVRPGMRVKVPFGPRRVDAYCVGLTTVAEVSRLKDIEKVLDAEPLLDGEQIELARWIARTYCAGLGEVLDCMLPGAVRKKESKRKKKVEPCALEGAGPVEKELPPEPTREQQRALEKIGAVLRAGKYKGFLLFGVTGSGKTEVYLRAIEEVTAGGKQAIVLVPEIALTPQTIERFRRRFDGIAVMHSGMSEKERREHWRDIASGRARVVVGARSAVFAPARNLGLIVIDEEHEPTFKQANSPRYHTRDVAIWRAKHGNFPVILGSATPSLESYAEVGRGHFDLLELTRRVKGRPMPRVDIVDMRTEMYARHGDKILSRALEQRLKAAMDRGEQAMLFLNRRGFSTVLHCPRCGSSLRCSDCDITLTYHRDVDRAVCHYCGKHEEVPPKCPECKGGSLKAMGLGTERVEGEVKGLFPSARVQRMDSDTMGHQGAYEELIRAVREGEVDILVGTQMIAKGHDFPEVTVVGVVGADTALLLPDFRARERTFQLIAQMAGRTGRGEKGGEVVVQTFRPEDFSIQFACKHDYLGFAPRELADRKTDGYPPFGRLARVVMEAANLGELKKQAEAIAGELREAAPGGVVAILGPVECPISRLRGQNRMHIVLKAPPEFDFTDVLAKVRGRLAPRKALRVIVDVDPVSML